MHNKALTFAKVTNVGYVAYPTPDLDGGGPRLRCSLELSLDRSRGAVCIRLEEAGGVLEDGWNFLFSVAFI